MKRRCPSRIFKPKKRARIEELLKLEESTITCTSESATETTTDPAPDWSLMLPEVLLRIFNKLDYDSLRTCATACRFWLQCANDESLALVLIKTIPFKSYPDEAGWKVLKVNYKSLRSDGEYDNKVVSLVRCELQADKNSFSSFMRQQRKKTLNYLNEDYIELREDERGRLGIYLKAAKLPENIDDSVADTLHYRLLKDIGKMNARSASKVYKESFDPMDPRSLSLEPYLSLNDDQQQAVLWMMDKEAGKTTFSIRPMLPLKHTPLALHIPSNKFRMKRDIPEVTVSVSSGLIVADTFDTAAGEVIGLIYATLQETNQKGLKTIIVVRDGPRANCWTEYLRKVPGLTFKINPTPNYVKHEQKDPKAVWIYTRGAYTKLNYAKIPSARIIFDEVGPEHRDRKYPGFEWHLTILNRSWPDIRAKDLCDLIKIEISDRDFVHQIQSSTDTAMFFRYWKLAPLMAQHCMWICRHREFTLSIRQLQKIGPWFHHDMAVRRYFYGGEKFFAEY